MSWKEDFIAKHGEAAYEKMLARKRAYYKVHKEESNACSKKWREEHPEEVIVNTQEASRKGGRYYAKHLAYKQIGIPGERHKIRMKHGSVWREYKEIIAPESQIHHEWIPDTADYRGVALVEKEAHQYGIVDVIYILDGKITLLTEESIQRGVK